jgi:hypothetical protein
MICPARTFRVAHQFVQRPDSEAVRPHDRLGTAARAAGEHFERAALVGGYRHCTPVRLSRGGCSFQYGRTSAPMMPHPRAHHPRSERRHRHVIRPLIGVDDHFGGDIASSTPQATARHALLLPGKRPAAGKDYPAKE